jgi:hypothetical protein
LKLPRVLLWDVENSPSLVWVYDYFRKGNVVATEAEWFMLSFAYRWLGEKETYVRALPDYPGYNDARRCDRSLLQDLHDTLSAADVCIAHNGDKHDIRKAYTRFSYWNMPPPTPALSIDTLKAAKKHFKLGQNNLGAIGEFYQLGPKMPTTGFAMHRRCIEGDPEAWEQLKAYNIRDVDLLHDCYMRMRPYISSHPNLRLLAERPQGCPVCLSLNVKYSGWNYYRTGKKQRYKCEACGYRYSDGALIRGA